ncbi:MAG: hypothetical protein HKP38_01765 [Croceitalea sp.]|nr:hypothetical protein [Croceitalea sp.]MBT8237663.1 hypothetical protein [Croceitalea sp.]NNC34792.1 hypothetical protein [Croceitalea sp.]NNL07930.1 hypothetical protein [Croceitalea sp.]NNM17264.1 hypothetical protein [Croceitalea sp.]
MRRIIVDYKKLDHETAALLIDLYPHGYGDEDIIVLKKPDGELIEAVEVRTEDTIYLVKISKSLANFISNFEETIEKELDDDTKEPVLEEENPDNELDMDLEGDLDSDDNY